MRGKSSIFIAVIAALAVTGPASAQELKTTPVQEIYGSPGSGEVLNTVGTGGNGTIPPPGGGGGVQGANSNGGENTVAPAAPRREAGADAPVVATGDSLPFTGFEAGLVAMLGLALLGAGFAMRRLSGGGAPA